MSLFSELRRRNIFKVALVYIVAAWLLVKLTAWVLSQLGLPGWIERLVEIVLAVGFPLALYFAYIYEITPVGLKKTIEVDQTQSIVYKTGQKLNAALAVLAVLLVAALVVGRLFPEPPVFEEDEEAAESRVAILSSVAAGVPAEIRSFTLENGLRVVVWPDHDIPNVALYYFVRAGGRNEVPGITGLSHFFEHMLFNGTSKREPGEFDRLMEAAGGANNAYTNNDVTVYQDWFPRSALDLVFDLESDRLQNLVLEDEVIESERGVVYSERRTRVDNNNVGRLLEQVNANAFVAHPYQFPVIGWPSDIESWTREDLADYYRRYYAPNNITMIVSGDVTPEEIYRLAEKYFEGIPAQDPPDPVRTVEPEQAGERRVVVEAEAQAPLLHVAFHGGRSADPETLHMELLLNILAGGESSRLHRLLVEELGVALSVDVFQTDGFDPGLVYFYLALPPGADTADVEARLFAELDRVAAEGVTEQELAKARNIMLADFWRGLATIDGKAGALGNAEVFHGNYEALFRLPERLDAADTEALQRAAGRVFRRGNATVGTLLPAAAGDAP